MDLFFIKTSAGIVVYSDPLIRLVNLPSCPLIITLFLTRYRSVYPRFLNYSQIYSCLRLMLSSFFLLLPV